MQLPGHALVVSLACLCCGCAPSVPDIPTPARTQVPGHAPLLPWFAQGRLELSYPGHFMSCTALVRHLADGHLRLVLLSDEGLELLDLTCDAHGYRVTMALSELSRAIGPLARLVRHAYGAPVEAPPRWDDDHLLMVSEQDERLYGGDPILLRAVSGPGLNLELCDYRLLGNELLAHVVTGSAPFITLTLRLESVQERALSPLPAK